MPPAGSAPQFVRCSAYLPDLHSFHTRRSSDLALATLPEAKPHRFVLYANCPSEAEAKQRLGFELPPSWEVKRSEDTRLNSSHTVISYAVFCLKKKKDSGKVAVCNEQHWV